MTTIKDKGLLMFSTLVCLLPIAIYLMVFDLLPEQMIQHWGAGGTPTWAMPREFAVWALPLFLAIIHIIVYIALNITSAKKSTPPAMQALLVWIVPVISVFTNILVLFANINENFAIDVFIFVFIGLLFIIIGNYLPKTRQNYFIGFRVPWTLRCADNWTRTHRLGGKTLIAAGVIFIVGAVTSTSETALLFTVISALTLSVIIPSIYSYVIYKRG